jgi:ABC-type uncharacterized transport system auxiliary subunit
MKTYVYFLFILLPVLTGCMSEKRIVRKYYTLEIPVDRLPAATDSVPVIQGTCQIDQAEVGQIYDKNQIVNRTGSNEVNYYVYHQWAIRPSDAVKELVYEYLRTAGVFETVTSGYQRSVADYRFRTLISRLEFIENNRSSSASLSLEFRLINVSDGRLILNHKADMIYPLDGKDMNLFATGVSIIIFREMDVFTKMIRDNRNLFKRDH